TRGRAATATTRPARARRQQQQQQQYLRTEWADRCVLYLDGDVGDSLRVSRADLSGAVVVDHARLRLNAEKLGLDFALPETTSTSPTGPSATRPASAKSSGPQLERIEAEGGVVCIVNK